MVAAYIAPDILNRAYERLGYGMLLIAVTVAIGISFALMVRPKK